MNWFKNLKIAKKLIISFLFVVLIVGFIGYVGIANLTALDDSNITMYERSTIPLSQLGEFSEAFQRGRFNLLEGITSKPEDMDRQFGQSKDKFTKADKNLDLIEKTAASPEQITLIANIKKLISEFYVLREKIIELAKNGQVEESMFVFKDQLNASENKIQEAVNAFNKLKVNNARERSEQNTADANGTINLMYILIAVGVILALLLGAFLSKIIGNPINKTVTIIQEMSRGHLGNRLNMDTKDEIGIMANTLDQFSEDLQKSVIGALIKISEGDTSIDVKTKDDKDEITPALIRLVRTMSDLISETNMLSKAAVEGKLHTRGNAAKFNGGYKEIINGVNSIFDGVVQPLNESSKILEKIAGGDLTVRMMGEYKGDYTLIKDSVNGLAESVGSALSEVKSAVEATASASTQISSSTEEMAAGAQEQSTQTTEVAGAIEEMTKTILETTKNAGSAAEQAKKSGLAAEEGGIVIKETIEGMNKIAKVVKSAALTVQELGTNSEQIGTIVQVIDDIADQTNLLALNAAIEAARAGEQGRGFAVVADEVRKLAERTTKATKEIGEMIKKIQKDTGEAVKSMDLGTQEVEKGIQFVEKSGKSLNEIIVSANGVVDVISQVAAASEEQSSAAEQISKSIEGINGVTQQSAIGVQQIARAAEDLNNLTMNLQNLVEKFKIDDESMHHNLLRGESKSRLAVRSNGTLLKA